MKKILFLLCALFLAPKGAFSMEADSILGTWLTEKKDALVTMYKCNERYCGKIVWLKDPKNEDGTDKVDENNPEPARQKDKIVGLTIARDFKHGGKNRWNDGTIYDPDNGKTYSCKIKINGEKLDLRGYVGISLFGRTSVWTRKK